MRRRLGQRKDVRRWRTPRLKHALGRRRADSEGKTLKMIRLPGWLPSSPALAQVAPRGSLIGPARRGGSPHRVLRTSARPRAVGNRQSGPSSYGTFRSAGADLRLGGLQSGLLEHAFGRCAGWYTGAAATCGVAGPAWGSSPSWANRCGQHQAPAVQPRRAADTGRAHLER